jgi:hypothetical protein
MVGRRFLVPKILLKGIHHTPVTLTATFYKSDWLHPKTSSADLIVPLSTMKADQSNLFTIPPTGNVSFFASCSQIPIPYRPL